MIARPAAAALSCRSCQHALFRAVLSTQAPSAAQRITFGRRAPHASKTPLARRLYSSDSKSTPAATHANETIQEELIEDNVEEDNAESGTPWFLEVEAPRHPASQHAVNLPKPPEGAPELLEPMIKYIYEDMGLDELSLLDLRDLDPPAALGPNLIMLLATARSERHLHVSAGRFVKWLRKNHKVTAKAGGLIGPGELKTKLRRLRKKAKLLGTNTAIVPGGDNGISTGWVCVNFTTSGGQTGESERVDEEGKFSGFGSALSGTTVVIQCMTEARRQELDLETLWQGILKRSLREAEEVKGQGRPDDGEIHDLVRSRVQLSGTPAQLQWQALSEASQQQNNQQKRFFSTSLRRLAPSSQTPGADIAEATEQDSHNEGIAGDKVAGKEEVAPSHSQLRPSLADLQESIADLQVMGQSIPDETKLALLISNVLVLPLVEEDTARARIALLDQILLTAHERGMKIMSTGILVKLIDGLVRSPAWGEETQRAQQNIEMLLAQKKTKLDENEATILMEAHASRGDWTKFWDIFNWNTRFGVTRHFALYEVAFRSLADSGDASLCLDGLRTVWPEFVQEESTLAAMEELMPVLRSARRCILVADPSTPEIIANPPRGYVGLHHEGRRLMKEHNRLWEKASKNLRHKGVATHL